jgi:hypothetical protein
MIAGGDRMARMRSLTWLIAASLLPLSLRADEASDAFSGVRPILAKYCFECHGGDKPQADLNLADFKDESAILLGRAQWRRVSEVLHALEMPPEGKPQPSAAERETITRWLEALLKRPDPDGHRDPGHVVVRRLNRVEYNNTIYDLFALNKPQTYFRPQQGLPESVRLVLHRNYRPTIVELPPDDVGYGYDNIGEVLSLPPFLMEKYFAAARAVADLALGQAPPVGRQPRQNKSRYLQLRGGAMNRESAQAILAPLVARALRREVSNEELERYLALFDLAQSRGDSFDDALKVPIQALLVSPEFLFRIEQGDPQSAADGVRRLTDHELATRLSYFLWSTLPDDELFRLAREGRLRDPDVLEAQARRMLRSPKAKELAENFALQWLQITTVEGAMPDPERFPVFHRRYFATALRQEALLHFETIMIEDRSVLELVDADFAWLNGTLADFYGVAPGESRVQNSSLFWKRYQLTDRRRGGVLTMGGPLVITSNSTRTSPVKRGKWILETLLGAPPPPPLANVPDLDNTPPAEDGISLREKLERHRADPNCASCHRRMDPLGLALENYDAIGAWREKDGPLEIDPSATLADGASFSGAVELKDLLVHQRRDDFVRCLTEHLLTYALGRKVEYFDGPAIAEIGAAVAKDDYRFSTLISEIVRSHPFRHVRALEVSHE